MMTENKTERIKAARKKLGKTFAGYRNSKGLKLQNVADATGLRLSLVSDFEHGGSLTRANFDTLKSFYAERNVEGFDNALLEQLFAVAHMRATQAPLPDHASASTDDADEPSSPEPEEHSAIRNARKILAGQCALYRITAGMTQQGLADAIDGSRSQIYELENNGRMPPDVFKKLTSFFQSKIPDFDVDAIKKLYKTAHRQIVPIAASTTSDSRSATPVTIDAAWRENLFQQPEEKRFGIFLRALRESIRPRIIQPELAQLSGIDETKSEGYIGRLEQGGPLPSAPDAIKLANTLQLKGWKRSDFLTLACPEIGKRWHRALGETEGFLAFHEPWLDKQPPQKTMGIICACIT